MGGRRRGYQWKGGSDIWTLPLLKGARDIPAKHHSFKAGLGKKAETWAPRDNANSLIHCELKSIAPVRLFMRLAHVSNFAYR